MCVKWLLFAGMAVTLCQESNVAQLQGGDSEIVDGSREAELFGEVLTSQNGGPFFMVFQIASGVTVRYNNHFLDRRAENCSAPSLCNHQLWLSPEVCTSTAILTFFPSLSVEFSYTGIELCKYFAASRLQCSCDHCLSELDSTSPGNDRVEPWTLQLSGVFIFILAITVIVLTITVIVLAILLCMARQRNKGTDQKKGDVFLQESLKYPSLNRASHNVTNFDDGEQHSDGESEDNVSTGDAKVSEVASDKRNGLMAINEVDISRRSMPGQHNPSRLGKVVAEIEPRRQSEETERPKPESCEPPKDMPGAETTDDKTPHGLPPSPLVPGVG